MKVLVVDDEYEKVVSISEVLGSIGLKNLEIDHQTSSASARRQLIATEYDLLIIDLYLPDAIGDTPNHHGGLSLFKLLQTDSRVNLPTMTIFITSKEDNDHLDISIQILGAELLKYKNGEDKWKHLLKGKVEYLNLRKQRGLRDRNQVDIAIITALRSTELEAVLNLPYSWESKFIQGDSTPYHFGRLQIHDKSVSIVAASAMRKGMPSSAALASKLNSIFRPKYMLMLGICAGIEGKVNFGDIVVASPTWDWGAGKSINNEDGSPVFLSAPYQMSIDSGIHQLATEISKDTVLLNRIEKDWGEPTPSTKLKAYVGPMASGASVIADDFSVTNISNQHREIIAIEMEAYAVMAASEYAPLPKPLPIVIKSICDFANPEKNDDWQRYAAYTSCMFADELIKNLTF